MTGLWLVILRTCFGAVPLSRTFGPAVLAGGAMVGVVEIVSLAVGGSSPWRTLAFAVPIGAVVYLAILWRLAGDDVEGGLRQLRDALRRRASGQMVVANRVHDKRGA